MNKAKQLKYQTSNHLQLDDLNYLQLNNLRFTICRFAQPPVNHLALQPFQPFSPGFHALLKDKVSKPADHT